MNEKYMLEAIKEANKCENDVPVGAIITDSNGKIVAKAHNIKEKENDSTAHAEIIAIRKACKKMKTNYLTGCTIYVTLEPCMMCTGAIIESKITNLIYGTKSNKYGFTYSVEYLASHNNNYCLKIADGVCKKQCQNILKNFFKNKRS